MPVTLAIRNGGIVTERGDVTRADVLLDENMIVHVGSLETELSTPELDATNCLVLPGLINSHTHAHNNLARGVADNMTLEDLRGFSSSLVPNRTPDDHYVSAALGAIEMVLSGCTTAYDQFAGASDSDEVIDAVAQAYLDVGLRAVLAPGLSDVSFYDAIPGLRAAIPSELQANLASPVRSSRELLDVTERAIQSWDGAGSGRIRIGIAPSIPNECSDKLLAGCGELMRRYDVTLQTHVAESKVQALASVETHGRTIVSRLAQHGLLGPRSVAGHAIWVTEDDIQLLARTGTSVAHNPASNLRLGSGIAPVRELLDAGVNVGLGTDGNMSSDNQNMFEAMRFAGSIGSIRFGYQANRWVSAADVWHMATRGGAKLVDQANSIGSIESGFRADLVILQTDSTMMTPSFNVRNALVYAQSGVDVRTVIVDGRIVADHGRVLTIDKQSIIRRVQEAFVRAQDRNGPGRTSARLLAPYVAEHCLAMAQQPFVVDRFAG